MDPDTYQEKYYSFFSTYDSISSPARTVSTGLVKLASGTPLGGHIRISDCFYLFNIVFGNDFIKCAEIGIGAGAPVLRGITFLWYE